MPNPIVSKLSKALIALADKGENVPINRVEKIYWRSIKKFDIQVMRL